MAPGPLRELKDFLYELYLRADQPTLDELEAAIADDDDLPGAPRRDTIRRYIAGPDWPSESLDLKAITGVLARMAAHDEIAMAADIDRAVQLWVASCPVKLDDGTRRAYLRALVSRYQNLELSALTPDGFDEAQPVLLGQVFEPQQALSS